MKSSNHFIRAIGLALCFIASNHAQVFSPGNLAVLRLGDGTQTLTNSGNTVCLDEYSPTGVLVNSVILPDNATNALLLSGTASSEGGLTRSLDRTLLVITGYTTNRSTVIGSLASTLGAAVPRGVATMSAFGTYNLVQTDIYVCSGNNIRCGTGDGTNSYWTAGANSGTCYFNPPNPPTVSQSSIANTRYLKAINGNLHFSTQAGTPGIYTFQGGGLPKLSTATGLLFGTGFDSQPAAFDMNPSLTVAYVADQRNSAGGIQKWINNAGIWSLAYTFPTGAGGFGVAADFSGPAPVVYATTGEAVSNRLVRIVDTNSSAVVTLLATAGGSRWFRGVDFVPDLRPLIVSQPQSQVVTNGAEVSFTVTAASVYPFGYQWQQNETNLAGATNSTLTLHSVTAADQAAYRVVVTNQYGSVVSADAMLAVNTILVPPSIVSQPQSQTNALGGGVAFSVSAGGTDPFHYQWRFNGGELGGETSSSLTLSCLNAAAQGTYSVSITNVAGATNSQAALLTVLLPPASSVAYSQTGLLYTQDFNSLPNAGTTSVNADSPVTIGTAVYGVANPFDFAVPVIACDNGVGGLGLSNALTGWYGAGAVAAKLGASAGDQSTGGIISFGSTNSFDASTNRALGLLATSSTGGTAFGVRLLNATTNTLTQMTLQFTGELWRQSAVPKTLAFCYWIDPTGTNTLSTNVTAALTNLSVSFPTNPAAATPIPVDGTATTNQLNLCVVNQPITNWPPGAALWLVWRMADPAAKGQGLAIDDLAFSASTPAPTVPTALVIRVSGTNVLLSWSEAAAGYGLQACSVLGHSNNWANIAESVVVTNGSNMVTVLLGGNSRYFRLKQ
jgi:hypothetical protein